MMVLIALRSTVIGLFVVMAIFAGGTPPLSAQTPSGSGVIDSVPDLAGAAWKRMIVPPVSKERAFAKSAQVNWTMLNGPNSGKVVSVAVNQYGHIFAGTISNGVLRSTDGGVSWPAVNTGMDAGASVEDIFIHSNGMIFLATMKGIYRSSNNGSSWQQVLCCHPFRSIIQDGSGYLFAASHFGDGVFRSSDLGSNWIQMNSGLIDSRASSLLWTSRGTVLAGTGDILGTGKGMFRSSNSGVTWSHVGLTDAAVICTIIEDFNGYLYAGTGYLSNYGHGIFFSSDGGSSWQQRSNGLIVADAIREMTARFDGMLFAASPRRLYISSDQGQSWSYGELDHSNSVYTASDGTVYVGTIDGFVYRSSTVASGPRIAVSPSNINFGSTQVGKSAIVRMEISNPGNATLELQSISIGGDAQSFSVQQPGSYSIAPGNRVTVDVQFHPQSAGAKSGEVLITSNVAQQSTVSCPLTGTGTVQQKPVITVAPERLEFGTISIGVEKESAFEIRNTGNATLEIQRIILMGTDASSYRLVDQGSTSIASNSATIVRVAFEPGSSGEKNANLRIDSNDPDNPTTGVVLHGTGKQLEIKPHITVIGFTEICEGEATTLQAPGGYASYEWSTGEHTQNITVHQTGLYSVTVYDQYNNSGTSDPVRIVAYPNPTPGITYTGKTRFCQGDSLVLDAGAGYAQYLWSTGDTTRHLVARESGAYAVTVMTSAGCFGVSQPVSVSVDDFTQPEIAITGKTQLCEGESVTLDAGPGYLEYHWSSGETTRSITVYTAGTYIVHVKNIYGCEGNSDPIRVEVKPSPPIPIVERYQDVLMTGNAHAHQWYRDASPIPGATDQFLKLGATGVYQVEVWNENGCSTMSEELLISVLGIDPLVESPEFQVYPQPAWDVLSVQMQGSLHGTVTLQLQDMLGRIMIDRTFEADAGFDVMRLDVRDVPRGVHLMRLTAGSRSSVQLICVE